MANAQRGEADLVIGGKTFTLQYGWNAIAQIETVTGFGVNDVASMITKQNFRGSVFRAVLWGMLRRHHPDLDMEAVGDLMDEADDPSVLSQAVLEAMNNSSAGGGGGKGNPQKASP